MKKNRQRIEDQLIGSLLLGDRAEYILDTAIMMGCGEEWFSTTQNRMTWVAATELFADEKPINIHTLLMKNPAINLDQAEKKVDDTFLTAEAEYHINALRDAVRLVKTSEALKACQGMADRWDGSEADPLLAKIHDTILNSDIQEHAKDDNPTDAAIDLIDYWQSTPLADRKGLHWFIPYLDKVIGPLTNEYVILEAARSVGKTAFALNMMVHCALNGKRCSMASLESGKEAIGNRLITVVTGINAMNLRSGEVLKDRYDLAKARMRQFKEAPQGWTFTARSIEQLIVWAKLEKKKGSQCIFIDNMRHVQAERGRSKTEEFGTISLGCKRIRDTVGLPVVLLHHLNKEGQTAWSQDIENDADMIIKLTRESLSPVPDETGAHQWMPYELDKVGEDGKALPQQDIRFSLTKHREGRTGELAMVFNKSKQKFLCEK